MDATMTAKIKTLPYLKSKRQAGRYLNVSEASVERLMKNGLAYIKVGGLVRFRPEDLAEYLDRNRHGAVPQVEGKSTAA
jgi:excisionase family DNA binding protein